MTNGNGNGNTPTSPENRLNRFDTQLWHRFVAIAQPYWYPTERNGGKVFFVLIALLILFLFATLAIVVAAITLLLQLLFPEFMGQTAGGMVSISRGIFSPPFIFVVLAGLLIPALGFFAARGNVLPRWKQWAFLVLLLALSLSVSGMNVMISYVGNYFTTALSERDAPTFWRFFIVYAGVFAIATPFVVYYQYTEGLLGLRWRDWMTGKFLGRYFADRAYYDINSNSEIDNPDQRISQDIRAFTENSLSFFLIFLGAFIDVLSFTGILLSKSGFLAIFLVGYAIFGTGVIAVLGRRLIALNFNQLRKEADFRYGLVHVRDNAESIAFYQGEDQEVGQLRRRFVEVLRNYNFLIGWQRNLAFFRTPYRYATYILPSIILAPKYFAGEIQFGDISQANFAFAQIFEAFALVVTQINRLSEFAAGVNRLETFAVVLNEQEEERADTTAEIQTVEDDRIALEGVTLLTPRSQRMLVQNLSATLQAGQGLVIVGPSGAGKSSLLRAIAGLWNSGDGRIVRPGLTEMMFLPQRPYMLLGTLRDQLLYPNLVDATVNNDDFHAALQQVNLKDLPDRVGGFDVELDWATVLSLGEQQRLAFARLLLTNPRYAVLDEATSALDLGNEQRLYDQLKSKDTTFISVGHRPSLLKYHNYVLELHGDGTWKMSPLENYQVDANVFS
ncbi:MULTISPECIES: ABC transporter ATP-binding protein/permease [unclassified Leptolyngbya]|uniref:ABC transporter ATP-binding protein/permease n=1 Tax=unclassified Leptolyngbya TaxID=2650499 RepID=UPI001689C3C5|nr:MULTISPECIES: ABC transporter ATP-binding protein/permease [unclassified Leptolyngbya]MBD1909499.1 ABC transporter ATP-binding protein/permease [Leptolyngbya sp. FACHB-8]MBD2159016.1 ABC transporter ATP-binding protein/permease [Leptolyngbya sp. FACHB-16]